MVKKKEAIFTKDTKDIFTVIVRSDNLPPYYPLKC